MIESFSRVARELLEGYRSASISSHLCLESDLDSRFWYFLMRIARIVSQTVGVHCTCIFELESS